jgi:hypothetical protein
MKLAVERLAGEPGTELVLLGGSIAKGIERPDSDVDMIVVVSDTSYQDRMQGGSVNFFYTDICDWKGGYVEGRFISRSFLLAAAERGSEPTRHSFTGVLPLWGDDPELLHALPRIPVYPDHEREARMNSFYAQLVIWSRYFWNEAIRMGDPVLQTRAASEIVLFGVRLVLAHNRVLFPCQKRLMEALDRCVDRPQGLAELTVRLVRKQETADMHAFCEAIEQCIGPRTCDVLSHFTLDVEMSWFNRSYAVSEW